MAGWPDGSIAGRESQQVRDSLLRSLPPALPQCPDQIAILQSRDHVMHLLLLGISHRTAPVELRERLDFQAPGLQSAVRALASRGSTREAVVVSTCNRAELYVACDEPDAARADLLNFISEFHSVDRS